MFVLDDIVGDCQSLTRTFSDTFGSKKWIEYSAADIFRNAGSGILNADLDRLREMA